MTYQKVYITGSEEKPTPSKKEENEALMQLLKESPPEKEKEKPHCPEIVINRNKYTVPAKKKSRIFRTSLGKIIAVTALCSVSFVLGCTFTNEKIAKSIESIAVFSSGSLKASEDTGKQPEKMTFYEKYMSEEPEGVPVKTFEYLSAEDTAENVLPKNAYVSAPTEEVAVSDTSSGKIGGDEVLYTVLSEDMSASDVYTLTNQTRYSPDTHALAEKTPLALQNLSVNPDEPLVLIVHTHGTECYNSYSDGNFVSAGTAVRSQNINENVVGIGSKIASVLEDFGIPVIHSEKMCDSESFVNAYSTSFSEVKSYLEKYPSIRFVIDLHRDAIELADGSKKKPVFDVYGRKTAQLMLVVGTDQAGATHSAWQENLSFALTLQEKISENNPQLFRRINLRTASFNQQLSPGYILLECGSAANTFEEAENAAEMFATGFAGVIAEYAG